MTIAFPPHAYVPGRTRRHDEDAFSDICAGVNARMDAAGLAESMAWRAGLAYLEAGFFWEAHEVLEPVWMALPQDSYERRFVQAVIQLANAGLKDRMERPRAVTRLCDMVDAILDDLPERETIMGVEPRTLREKAGQIRSRSTKSAV